MNHNQPKDKSSKILHKSSSAKNISNNRYINNNSINNINYNNKRKSNKNSSPKDKIKNFKESFQHSYNLKYQQNYPFSITEKRFRWQEEKNFCTMINIFNKSKKQQHKYVKSYFDKNFTLKEDSEHAFQENEKEKLKTKIKRQKKSLYMSSINSKYGPTKRVLEPEYNRDPSDCFYKFQKKYNNNNNNNCYNNVSYNDNDKNEKSERGIKGGLLQCLLDKTPLKMNLKGKKIVRNKNKDSIFSSDVERKKMINKDYNPGVRRFNHASNKFDHFFNAFPCQYDLYSNIDVEKVSKNYSEYVIGKNTLTKKVKLIKCHCRTSSLIY